MRVALLEGGAKITPKDFTEHTQTWQMPFLGYVALTVRTCDYITREYAGKA